MDRPNLYKHSFLSGLDLHVRGYLQLHGGDRAGGAPENNHNHLAKAVRNFRHLAVGPSDSKIQNRLAFIWREHLLLRLIHNRIVAIVGRTSNTVAPWTESGSRT